MVSGCAHHEEPQISLHLLAAVPHGIAVEIFPDPDRDPLWYDLPVKQPEIRDGYMFVPEGPGFGIELDEEDDWEVEGAGGVTIPPTPEWMSSGQTL